MCHRSWCAEHAGHEPNERLEFLGDAVLGLIVADHVFRAYPEHDEGWLSRARSSVVRASALGEMAAGLDIGVALRLGKGEAASGGREKTSILADAMEAVIGAVYLDGGWPAASTLVLGLIEDRIAAIPTGRGDQDHKSMLQELASREFQAKPTYEVHESGPEHHKLFEVTVLLKGQRWGQGRGRSKKEAEQVAAEAALDVLVQAVQDGHRGDGGFPPVTTSMTSMVAPAPPLALDHATPTAPAPPTETGEPHA